MKNLGIKSRVILLGTLPAVLFSLILAGYAISKVFAILILSVVAAVIISAGMFNQSQALIVLWKATPLTMVLLGDVLLGEN